MEKDSLLLDALGVLFGGIIKTQPTKFSKKLNFEKYVNKSLSFATIVSDLESEKTNDLTDFQKYLISVSKKDKIDIFPKKLSNFYLRYL